MADIQKLTPNLIVSNVDRSLAFYEGVLGFTRGMTVPEQPPFVFAAVTNGPVEIFFNDRSTVSKENPQMAGLRPGGGNTMFIELTGVDGFHDDIKDRVRILMPPATQWYGMREFAIVDPDGYVITFAERVTNSRKSGQRIVVATSRFDEIRRRAPAK